MLPLPVLTGLIAAVVLFALLQFGAIAIAFGRLGLSTDAAVALLLCSLIGSAINLPLLRLRTRPARDLLAASRLPDFTLPPYTGTTVLAVNVGGGLTPTALCGYLLVHQHLPLRELSLGILLISFVCYLLRRPPRRSAVSLAVLIAPLLAALFGLLVTPAHSAPIAYICATLGMLIGIDLLRLKEIAGQRVPRAALGGAGTFDGIFITGIIAALLA